MRLTCLVGQALARTLPIAVEDAPSQQQQHEQEHEQPASGPVVTAKALADEFEKYLAAYGANSSNLLAYAPGADSIEFAFCAPFLLLENDRLARRARDNHKRIHMKTRACCRRRGGEHRCG
jgi:hypothetical protein